MTLISILVSKLSVYCEGITLQMLEALREHLQVFVKETGSTGA